MNIANVNKDFEKVYVLDTNIILNDAKSILTLSEQGKNLIVLPETTIDELDTKKSGFDEINFQAREFARILDSTKVQEVKDNGRVISIHVSLDDLHIHIISMKDYKLDNVDPKIVNDRKIIAVAEYIQSEHKNSYLISNDIMCRTRAISLGVNTKALEGNKSEDTPLEFIKVVPLDSSLFNSLKNKDIKEYDKDYSPENFCYKFESEDGNSQYAYIVNQRINLITEKTFDKMYVKPNNEGQKYAVSGMLDTRVDISVIEAPSGSGKTLLALSTAIRLVEEGKYEKIYYIRNSVESLDKGEDVGYLSSNEAKFAIYNHPLYDSLEFIARSTFGKNKPTKEQVEEKVQSFISKYGMETIWIGEMRGRSFTSVPSIGIVDEGQNMSNKSLQTVMTRFGKGCKLFVIGSQNQIDNLYINKYTNGLSTLLKSLKSPHENVTLFATKLSKVVRGVIAEFAENIFTK